MLTVLRFAAVFITLPFRDSAISIEVFPNIENIGLTNITLAHLMVCCIGELQYSTYHRLWLGERTRC